MHDRHPETGSASYARVCLITSCLCVTLAGCAIHRMETSMVYPTARQAAVVDDYHGTPVADPFRWLEDPDSAETQAWVEAQNVLTNEYVNHTPTRGRIEKRLTDLWDYPRYGVPTRIGNRYFFSKNDGLQSQSVLYVREGRDGEPRVLIDPNQLSEDGTVALSGRHLSHDGSLMAYGLSYSGSDQKEIHIRDVRTGEDRVEVLKWCKFASVAWKHDNSGFFYNRYPQPGSVPKEEETLHNRVYWHKLGTPQSEDTVLYERPDRKEWGFWPSMTEDGNYLLLYVQEGTETENRLYYRETENDGPFIKLMDEGDAKYDLVWNRGSRFYVHTTLDAPRGRIIGVDLNRPDRVNWKEIVPEQDEVITFVNAVNHQLVIGYMRDAHEILRVFNLDGSLEREIPLPAMGTVGACTGREEHTEMYFGFTSFLYPSTVFRYDFPSASFEEVFEPGVDFDPTLFETKQVFYTSKDGTRVPMFITHKKGLKLDGKNPTLLYGYGGFNISLTPYFSISRLAWLESGGVFALANLRGGGEYGEDWHLAGSLENKQNVFDDFIAAGRWLTENGYTSRSKLAIQGGSNGGLLVAACLLQEPEMFGAAVSQVPVTDMLRFQKFTAGRFWVTEYGNAEESAEDFRMLYAYSPLHNVRPGAEYPPTLITSADTDDRVVPMHAKKFAATLQTVQTGPNPILLRVETKAGHGGGKPTAKVIEELADIYGFLFRVLEVETPHTWD